MESSRARIKIITSCENMHTRPYACRSRLREYSQFMFESEDPWLTLPTVVGQASMAVPDVTRLLSH
eukprot:2413378-Rhodomonas_salina.1